MPCSQGMTRLLFLVLAVLSLPLASAAAPATTYRVVTNDGQTREASSLARFGAMFFVGTEAGPLEFPVDTIDFYGTFRANTTKGNVVAFMPGGLLRFESAIFADGRVTFELAEGRSITVSEAVVDFRTSVLEGSFTLLPANRSSRFDVAKATESPRPRREDRTEERVERPKSQTASPRTRTPRTNRTERTRKR